MKKWYSLLLILFVILPDRLSSQVTLSHNVGDVLVGATIYGCSWGDVYWARTFVLQDFGINPGDEFIINSGSVGIGRSPGWDTWVMFNIYKIDADFPASFSEADLIGSSQEREVFTQNDPQIVTINFDVPITVPANVNRILVEVHQMGSLNSEAIAFCADTAQDNDLSWFRSYCTSLSYTNTTDLGFNSRFYIVVNGQIVPAGLYNMTYDSNCHGLSKNFFLSNTEVITNVQWDFGDVTSGAQNTSSVINPSHNFSAPGSYTVVATVTNNLGVIDHVTRHVQVTAPPVANALQDIFACEDIAGSGIATTFNTSGINQAVLSGQTGKTISYYDAAGNALPSPLPNPMTNIIRNSQLITARVSNTADGTCYDETTFNLIVNPLPVAHTISTMFECDDNNDGLALFNLTTLEATLLGGQTGMAVSYISEGLQLPVPLPAVFNTTVASRQIITATVTNPVTGCTAQTDITLLTQSRPVANAVPQITGCDDDGDGISQYFDTAGIENTIIGNQAGVALAFYDATGNIIASLANPYTNIVPNYEVLIARVTNIQTGCFAETPITFKTTLQPVINTPQNIYSCDEGNGFAHFDTSLIEQQLTGNQSNLQVTYSDSAGAMLPSPLPVSFLNTTAYSQTIYVRVQDTSSALCYSETEFNLIVNPLPQMDLEHTYYLCDLVPSLRVVANPVFNSWLWEYQDGTLISAGNFADLSRAGNYTLTVTQNQNGISCSNSFTFKLERSQLPVIDNVISHDLSNNNSIEIVASGDGRLQYSIDGVHYYNSNSFSGLDGGVYKVYVKDRDGCGLDWKEVVLLDYPKFFSPNSDGQNDFWQITGIRKFPDANIYIFDRFGKLLSQIKPSEKGWDGQCKGVILPSSDYWFAAELANGKIFKGHFSLIR